MNAMTDPSTAVKRGICPDCGGPADLAGGKVGQHLTMRVRANGDGSLTTEQVSGRWCGGAGQRPERIIEEESEAGADDRPSCARDGCNRRFTPNEIRGKRFCSSTCKDAAHTDRGSAQRTAHRAAARAARQGGEQPAGRRFRACWPIEDSSVLFVQLRVQASQQIDAIAAEHGLRITGPLKWYVQNGRLFGDALVGRLVRPTGSALYGYVAQQHPVIRALATDRGLTDSRIADIYGCTESAIAKVRAKHGIAAGRGNPTLAGYSPERLGSAVAA